VVSAVGHEIDFTIADFVADLRAPTPSAAAELLVREKRVLVDTVVELEGRLLKCIRHELRQASLLLKSVTSGLRSPRDRINELRLRFDDWAGRLTAAATRGVERRREAVKRLETSLSALSPVQVLERGYSIAFVGGKAVKSSAQLPAGTHFKLRLHDGTVEADASS
jgi:exodeoxyribonuclease VII large subunit